MSSIKFLVSLLGLASVVFAHGSINEVRITGNNYPGATYGNQQSRSPLRRLSNMGEPITDPNSSSLICGVGAARSNVSAAAKPGARIEFFWRAEGNNGPWFHRDGES
jgi:hypothetical protein